MTMDVKSYLIGHTAGALEHAPRVPLSVLSVNALVAAIDRKAAELRVLSTTNVEAFVIEASAALGIEPPRIDVDAVQRYRAEEGT